MNRTFEVEEKENASPAGNLNCNATFDCSPAVNRTLCIIETGNLDEGQVPSASNSCLNTTSTLNRTNILPHESTPDFDLTQPISEVKQKTESRFDPNESVEICSLTPHKLVIGPKILYLDDTIDSSPNATQPAKSTPIIKPLHPFGPLDQSPMLFLDSLNEGTPEMSPSDKALTRHDDAESSKKCSGREKNMDVVTDFLADMINSLLVDSLTEHSPQTSITESPLTSPAVFSAARIKSVTGRPSISRETRMKSRLPLPPNSALRRNRLTHSGEGKRKFVSRIPCTPRLNKQTQSAPNTKTASPAMSQASDGYGDEGSPVFNFDEEMLARQAELILANINACDIGEEEPEEDNYEMIEDPPEADPVADEICREQLSEANTETHRSALTTEQTESENPVPTVNDVTDDSEMRMSTTEPPSSPQAHEISEKHPEVEHNKTMDNIEAMVSHGQTGNRTFTSEDKNSLNTTQTIEETSNDSTTITTQANGVESSGLNSTQIIDEKSDTQMEVDKPESPSKSKQAVKPTGDKKLASPSKKIGPGQIKLTRAQQLRLSLAPASTSKESSPKSAEKKKEPPKHVDDNEVIQKSKPKSKWADISKQIEHNKTIPKPAAAPTTRKSMLPPPLPPPASRIPTERRTSTSSDVSQTSSKLNETGIKKPLKRQNLLPPSSSAPKQKQPLTKPEENSKTAASSKTTQRRLKPPNSQTKKAVVAAPSSSQSGEDVKRCDSIQPDVIPSNTPTTKTNAKPKPLSPKEKEKLLNTQVTELNKQLDSQRIKLEQYIADLTQRQVLVESLQTELNKSTRSNTALSIVIQNYTDKLDSCHSRLVEELTRVEDLQLKHSAELEECQRQEELIRTSHAEEKQDVITRLAEQNQREVVKLKALSAEQLESLRTTLTSDHEDETTQLNTSHQSELTSLHSIIQTLKQENSKIKEQFDQATNALTKHGDLRVQAAVEPYKLLPHEIESLKTVIDMKNQEIKELRTENNSLKNKVEKIPDLEKQIDDLSQRFENTMACLDIVNSKERETTEKYYQLSQKAVKEKKENQRLSLNCEALAMKLEEADFVMNQSMNQSIHMDTLSSSLPCGLAPDSPVTSPAIAFTRSLSRSSLKRKTKPHNTNNNSTNIPEVNLNSLAPHFTPRSGSLSPQPLRKLAEKSLDETPISPSWISKSASSIPRHKQH